MGIPAAFRWLSNKYPKIISPAHEERPQVIDGVEVPVDTTKDNDANGPTDCLYLDYNGIVHNASHGNDEASYLTNSEILTAIFEYTDRVINIARPRRVLMIAIDGVAPRAKMVQQRQRRFRSAQEAQQQKEDKLALIQLMKQQNGGQLTDESLESMNKKAFDTNSITPGTPFMDVLAASLRYWCAYKLNTDPAWANLKVVISDATVPGEGEHKIMDFIRSQRSSPDHDPNTRHVLYGLDADLIMLGLATHEAHFRVLREDVFFQDSKARTCRICGQKGHEAQACRGDAKEKSGEFDEKDNAQPLKPFIWLHVSVLREYLAVELEVPRLPFRFDLERAIDDWIFLCCFVGNDFLPHLPALEIRENGIITLTSIWKQSLPIMGGYVTKDGHIDLDRAQHILNGLAKQEDSIFRKRKDVEDRREANAKRRKLQDEARNGSAPGNRNGSNNRPGDGPAEPPKVITHEMVVNRGSVQSANVANKSAASILKNQIQGLMNQPAPTASSSDQVPTKDADGAQVTEAAAAEPASALGKRKAAVMEEDNSSVSSTPKPGTPSAGQAAGEGPVDMVRLWEEGYADRYYQQKFHVDPSDTDFRREVAHAYVEGLAWVLLYYFQGCPSWEWYYPYHYAPFAKDFVGLADVKIHFERGRTSLPYEQLMSVLPAASRENLPEVFHDLMTNEDSEIIDFYPEEFEIDLNGKKFAWQGVALLPFVDMDRLLAAVRKKYPLLTPEEKARNGCGKEVLLISDAHQGLYDDIITSFYSKRQTGPEHELDPRTSDHLAGTVGKMDDYLPHGSLTVPLEGTGLPDIEYDRSLSVHYEFPKAHPHKSMIMRGVKMPDPALSQSDIEELRGKMRGGGGGGRHSYGNNSYGNSNYGNNSYGNKSYGNNSYGNNSYGNNSYGNNSHGNGSYGRGSHSNGHSNNGPRDSRDRWQPPQNMGWQPPPPGQPGFGVGALPPPPPPSQNHYYGGQSHGYNDSRSAPGYPQYPPGQPSHMSGYPPAQQSNYYSQQPPAYQGSYASGPPPPPGSGGGSSSWPGQSYRPNNSGGRNQYSHGDERNNRRGRDPRGYR